jgi:hypothetical protein
MILAVCVAILVMCNTRWATGMAGQAQVRLQVAVYRAGEAGQGPVWLATLWGVLSHCVAIEDLGKAVWGF